MKRRTRSQRSTISSSSSRRSSSSAAEGKTVQLIYFPSPLKDFTQNFVSHVYERFFSLNSPLPPLAASHPLVIKAALMKKCSIQQIGTVPKIFPRTPSVCKSKSRISAIYQRCGFSNDDNDDEETRP
jgi:hypothetical protein